MFGFGSAQSWLKRQNEILLLRAENKKLRSANDELRDAMAGLLSLAKRVRDEDLAVGRQESNEQKIYRAEQLLKRQVPG